MDWPGRPTPRGEQAVGERGDEKEVDSDEVSGLSGKKDTGHVGEGRGEAWRMDLATVSSMTT